MKASLPDSTSISSHFTPEYTVLLATFSAPAIQRLAIDCAKKRKREGGKNNLTLIVKHSFAVPASWTSMRQNSNTIYPLITQARISGAINWFWELSSIFNPSSGSVGPQWVKTSLQNQNEAGIWHIQGSSKGLEDLFMGPNQLRRPFNASYPKAETCANTHHLSTAKVLREGSSELCGRSWKKDMLRDF